MIPLDVLVAWLNDLIQWLDDQGRYNMPFTPSEMWQAITDYETATGKQFPPELRTLLTADITSEPAE